METIIVKDWFEKGSFYNINGHQIFVIDTKNSEVGYLNEKPVLCILHGFPTSSFDYWKVIEQLSLHFRVSIHDDLGYDFSNKPVKYSYSLINLTDAKLKNN